MKNFISAIQFLTVLPFGKQGIFAPKLIIPYFPLVGLLVGTLLSIFDQIAVRLFSVPMASLLDIGLLVVVSGALHVDGLGDAADGLFSHRPREQVLDIMKDSRVGVMGLIAIVLVTALKWGGIAELSTQRSLALIVIPALSRTSMMAGIRLLPYGRPAGGTGTDFFRHDLTLRDLWAVPIPVLLALCLGGRGLLLIAAFALTTAGVLFFYRRRLGCITGDMLGALNETVETVLFVCLAAGGMS